jgi:Interferon-induced transmembrane protein
MSDQGSTPPPPDPYEPPSEQPGGAPQGGGYGAPQGGGYGAPQGGGYGAPQGGGYGAPPPMPYGQPGYGAPAGPPPPNYLVWAILSTLFCCLPLGIASIVFAAQVNGKYAAGDFAGAQESSDKAKKFAMWSAIAGVIIAVLYLIGIVALGVGSDSS